MSRSGPPTSELATLGKRQLNLAEDRYHELLAAVQHKYHIDDHPSGPRRLHKVNFDAYLDRNLKSGEAAVDPRDGMKAYVIASRLLSRKW